jgi:hypothetical protein
MRGLGKHDAWERVGSSLMVDTTKLREAGWTPPTDTRNALARMVRK